MAVGKRIGRRGILEKAVGVGGTRVETWREEWSEGEEKKGGGTVLVMRVARCTDEPQVAKVQKEVGGDGANLGSDGTGNLAHGMEDGTGGRHRKCTGSEHNRHVQTGSATKP